MARRGIVVVGGGASGGLAALHLLRRAVAGTEITVVEPRDALGGGIAYSSPHPWHRINVPARTMGAMPDDPGDFAGWAGVDGASFAPRGLWGAYLAARIDEAAATSAGSLRHVQATAERLVGLGSGSDTAPGVQLADGSRLTADALVIATGNALPRVPDWCAQATGDPRVVADAWAPEALAGIGDRDVVAVLGTGHTAADVIETVLRTRLRARVVAVSRHGELPWVHDDPPRVRPDAPVFSVEAFRAFPDPLADGRAAIAAHAEGWRQGLDSLRPLHQQLWLAMDDGLRRRFLDGRRDWEVHRSRLPAAVGAELDGWVAEGRLEVRAFAAAGVEARPEGIVVTARDGTTLSVDRLVIATGPDEDAAATPLLRAGIEDGLLRVGPMGLGIDADPSSLRVLDAGGSSRRPVFAIGPVLRGVLWETIAVPEIRLQALEIAGRVLPGS